MIGNPAPESRRLGLVAERREAALAASLRALRERYRVRVEWPVAVAAADGAR